jgi:hypothetical protein
VLPVKHRLRRLVVGWLFVSSLVGGLLVSAGGWAGPLTSAEIAEKIARARDAVRAGKAGERQVLLPDGRTTVRKLETGACAKLHYAAAIATSLERQPNLTTAQGELIGKIKHYANGTLLLDAYRRVNQAKELEQHYLDPARGQKEALKLYQEAVDLVSAVRGGPLMRRIAPLPSLQDRLAREVVKGALTPLLAAAANDTARTAHPTVGDELKLRSLAAQLQENCRGLRRNEAAADAYDKALQVAKGIAPSVTRDRVNRELVKRDEESARKRAVHDRSFAGALERLASFLLVGPPAR